LRVYVETNFVLEIALRQEQAESCEEILRLCKLRRAELVLPALAIAESYETLVRRHKDRKRLRLDLDKEVGQLVRSEGYSKRVLDFKGLAALLSDSAEEEAKRLQAARDRLIRLARILPLDLPTMKSATTCEKRHSLPARDALIYASVIRDLRRRRSESCFLSRDAGDFDDPGLVEELRRKGCKVLFHFKDGLRYLRSRIKRRNWS
jgi:predicted nucleic acid-binding protein